MAGVYVFRPIDHLNSFNNFSPYVCIYNTRLTQRNIIDVVYPGSTHSRQFIVFRGEKVWNGTPMEIRESATCDTLGSTIRHTKSTERNVMDVICSTMGAVDDLKV